MKRVLTWKRAAVALAAAGMVATGAMSAAVAAGTPSASAPFFNSGTNGFPAPSNGAAKQVDEGRGGQGALLTSVGGAANEAGYGLVGVHFDGTFSQLSDVETQFNMTQGTCVGGAPRWVIHLQNSTTKATQKIWVNFDNAHQGYGGCNPGTQQEQNIIGGSDAWWVGGSNFPSTYAAVNFQYGTWKVQDVEIVLDAGWAQSSPPNPNLQQMLLQQMKVNNKTYFPLPH